MASLSKKLRRLLVGTPYDTQLLAKQRFGKAVGLPVLGANAFSSVAYAPDEIILMLALAGASALTLGPQVGIALVVLILILVWSYRQRLIAFPEGGDYQLVFRTLGRRPGLFVGAALLLDFVLTAAVSLSAASYYLMVLLPGTQGWGLALTLGLLAVLTLANIRGVGRGRTKVAAITYLFLLGMVALLVVGMVQYATGTLALAESAQQPIEPAPEFANGLHGMLGALLVVRAFSTGAAMATGIEVPASNAHLLTKPRGRNAGIILVIVGLVAALLTLGVLSLTQRTGIRLHYGHAEQQPPVLAQLSSTIFGPGSIVSYVLGALVIAVLVFAANSAFNSFPSLASQLAKDRFLPEQWAHRGDRLSYTHSVLWLAAATALLVLVTVANVAILVQLYVVGVFVAFTLSQWAMVVHWNRRLGQSAGRRVRGKIMRSRAINFVGFLAAAAVVLAVVLTRFVYGAWIIVLAGMLLVLLMGLINRHYRATAAELAVSVGEQKALPARVHGVILISAVNKPTMRAISYARAARPSTLEAVLIDTDQEQTASIEKAWAEHKIAVPLTIIASPYRELVNPVISHLRSKRLRSARELTVVYIPEFVVGSRFRALLHNKTAWRIKTALLFERNVMVVSVPWQLDSSDRISEAAPIKNQRERE
ncbi:APC family permease [Micrococcoides hystricis]|uniref:APC family permease n=1 Tax=Micrococcoides hystricis TaxID=1572761 RepID=A0ABV6P6X3_9MICC